MSEETFRVNNHNKILAAGLLIMMAGTMGIIFNLEERDTCEISYSNGTVMKAPQDFCRQLHEGELMYGGLTQLQASQNRTGVGFVPTECVCPIQDCPDVVCPECPSIMATTLPSPTTTIPSSSITVDYATQKKILNLRCGDCAVQYQGSYFKCRRDVIKLLGLK